MAILTGCWCVDLGFLVSLLAVYIAYKFQKLRNHFSKNGFHTIPFWTSLKMNWNLFLLKRNFQYHIDDVYKELKGHDVAGFFQLQMPFLMIRDPELAQKVLTKDFSHFHDHGFVTDLETNPLDQNLFNLNGEEWKVLRNKLTPLFSTGKLKWMYAQLVTSADELIEVLKKSTDQDILIRDFLSRYSIDIISSCAFGLDAGALRDPDCKFRQMSKKIFQQGKWGLLRMVLLRQFPFIGKLFKVKVFDQELEDFFLGVTRATIKHRKKIKESRNDFIQLLLELKESGSISLASKDDDDEATTENTLSSDPGKLVFTDELLAAQSFLFLVAGWENMSAVIGYALYFLGKNKGVQERLRKEIREVKAKNGGLITYAALKEMTYLDKCISESLRIEPPAGFIMRVCTKDYPLDDGRTIKKGEMVTVPNYSFQIDPQYYPDPLTYNPDRFETPGHKMTNTYMPFGSGPRVCIALRFALLQVNLGVAKIIDNFDVSVSPRVKEPIVRDPKTMQAEIVGGTWLQLKSLTT